MYSFGRSLLFPAMSDHLVFCHCITCSLQDCTEANLLSSTLQVFIQMFNSADAGTINVINALAALKAVDNSTISSSSAGGVMTSPQNAFGLDQQCLQRCGLGATGGGLSGLSAEMQVEVLPNSSQHL